MLLARRPRSGIAPRSTERGVTLIEVLLAVALIAILSGSLMFGTGLLSGSRERAAATLIMSGVRLGLSRATSGGRPTRLSFDLDNDRVVLEEAASSYFARTEDTEEEEESEEDADEESGALGTLQELALGDATAIVGGPRTPRPSFTPVDELKPEEGEEAGRILGNGVSLRSVQTQHDTEPITEGRAYLYFWPGGQTEHAVIHLGRADSDGLSVTVSALTGRARLVKGEAELPEERQDGEISEREEEQ